MSFEYNGKLCLHKIEQNCKALAEKLNYGFKDITYLCSALYCQKILNTKDKYKNSAIALIGDNVLKLSLSHKFYLEKEDKEFINNKKEKYESNCTLKNVCDEIEIYKYAFNDEDFYLENLPDHRKLPHSEHDPYVEAVIGAIYLDRGFDYTDKWIKETLLPIFKKAEN